MHSCDNFDPGLTLLPSQSVSNEAELVHQLPSAFPKAAGFVLEAFGFPIGMVCPRSDVPGNTPGSEARGACAVPIDSGCGASSTDCVVSGPACGVKIGTTRLFARAAVRIRGIYV